MCHDYFYLVARKRPLICLSLCLLVVSSFAQVKEPYTAHDYFELGEEFLLKEKPAEAVAAFNDCLRLNPHFTEAYYSRGLAREQLKQQEEAIIDYSIYLELRPDSYEAILNRSILRYNIKQYALAKEDFERLLHLPKQETTTIYFRQPAFGVGVDQIFTTQSSGRDYLFNWLGLTETQLGNYSNAILQFDSAIWLNPTDANYLVNRGMAYQQNKQLNEATQDFKKALTLNPHQATAKYNLSLLVTSDTKKVALLDSALSDNASMPYIYAERAYDKMQAGNYTGALRDYNEALRLDTTEPTYFLNRGLVNEKLQRYTAAYEDYTRALQLDERFEKAWLNRGNVLMRQHLYKEALDDYTSALFFNEQYGQAYYNRALAYQQLQQLNKACVDIRMAEALGLKVSSSLRAQLCK